jgi:FtsP/CotA-like multicopper oxidase with cupredoxin domain
VVRTLISETLEIWLHNEVPGETVALGFPGQDGLVPDLTGVPTGSAISYTLTFSQPGTFLYEAGLTEGGARQVAMGLAGPLIVGDGLPPTWDQEMVFVLGAIDPAFNLNPAGFSMTDYRPRYWLLNGRSYPDTGWLPTHAGNTILIRYLNASISSHAIGLLGLDQEIIAVDGSPLVLPYGIGPEAFSPGQTAEALVEVPVEAVNETGYTLYSGSLNQHNNNQRLTDMRAAFGGMLTFVKVVSGSRRGGDATKDDGGCRRDADCDLGG